MDNVPRQLQLPQLHDGMDSAWVVLCVYSESVAVLLLLLTPEEVVVVA